MNEQMNEQMKGILSNKWALIGVGLAAVLLALVIKKSGQKSTNQNDKRDHITVVVNNNEKRIKKSKKAEIETNEDDECEIVESVNKNVDNKEEVTNG